jgi:hypothetical protein
VKGCHGEKGLISVIAEDREALLGEE